MTPGDRRILVGIIKQRERVAKADAAKRSAELLADFDAQLEREFSFDDNEIWKQAVAKVEIEKQSVILQEKVVIGGLESEEARNLLAEIPSVDALMPSITVGQIKALPSGDRP